MSTGRNIWHEACSSILALGGSAVVGGGEGLLVAVLIILTSKYSSVLSVGPAAFVSSRTV